MTNAVSIRAMRTATALGFVLVVQALTACSRPVPSKVPAPEAPPPVEAAPDPVIARVNNRDIRRSWLDAERGSAPQTSAKSALQRLVRWSLLNQEADGSGLGKGLPGERGERAEAFLERHFSKRVLCANFTPREYQEMYIVMKPRFVRGHLYDVSEVHWRCDHKTSQGGDGCRRDAHTHANEQWRPILHAIRSVEDLRSLQGRESQNAALVFREQVIHVLEEDRSNAPAHLTDAVVSLAPGSSTVVVGPDGARLVLLRDHRLPVNRRIDDPGVRGEIRDELCPRTIRHHRGKYVHDLMKAAWLEVFHQHLPEGHDIPTKPTKGPVLQILATPEAQ